MIFFQEDWNIVKSINEIPHYRVAVSDAKYCLKTNRKIYFVILYLTAAVMRRTLLIFIVMKMVILVSSVLLSSSASA